MATEKRLIDANEMKNNIMEAMMRHFEKNGDQIALRIAEMMCHFIDVTDTVDAVEVVRCKDCKYALYDAEDNYYACINRDGIDDCVEKDDFCSYGERKKDFFFVPYRRG